MIRASVWLLLFAFCHGQLSAQAEFRAIGGSGFDHARVVIPHATGAFLAGVTKPQESDVARAYVVHYDEHLDHDWSMLLPFGDPIEHIVDGWSDGEGYATFLTERFVQGVGYKCAVHTVDSTGQWLGSHEPDHAFRPAVKVDWQGDPWAVGTSGTRPAALNLETGDLVQWGGLPGLTEEITDAQVSQGLLVAVGSQTTLDTTRAAIWAVYPLGQVAFEIIQPDTSVHRWSRADAIAVSPTSVRVLTTFGAPTPGNEGVESTLHSMVSINMSQGKVNGVLYGPSFGNRPGRDLIWTPQGWVKLSQTDFIPELGQSMLVTHYNNFGGYLSQGAWGTLFEDDPASVVAAADGSIWVAGSTKGTLDGTWNACLLKLDSLGPLDQWFSEPTGFGVLTDPLFGTLTQLEEMADDAPWACHPNPASGMTTLRRETQPWTGEALEWILVDAHGRQVRQGRGVDVPLDGLSAGRYSLALTDRGQRQVVPLHVAQ
jgi:hypothetical protein